ncbi:MAG: helix-turn-helix domain-containing protein [Negativibacillus massiliensis]|uniref:helix-turn-helix domain-containing protein n=1 Tax=Negativibacillus massiliensis TaxID=1871035 RepID=UPI0039A03066
MDEKFIGNKITQLRLKKNISEYQLSYDLGQSKSYIQSISSGRAMPSMKMFLNICDYFEITPAEFFDTQKDNRELLDLLKQECASLKDDDILLLLTIAKRLKINDAAI